MALDTVLPTKRCPGFAPGGQPAHELPATAEHFGSNAGNRDGLSSRCRACSSAYSTAWAAAKKKGEQFSVKAPGLRDGHGRPVAAETAEDWATEHRATGGAHYGITGPGSSSRTECPLCQPPAQLVVSEGQPTATYADPLAVKAHRGKAKGYSAELVDGVWYALPDGSAAGTAEGQLALEAVNLARAAARRKADAERKRRERAAAKERLAAQA